MNNQLLISNFEYKISNPPDVMEIIGGLSIVYVIKKEVYKETSYELFYKLYRYDYKVIDNKICDVEYFIIKDTDWIGETNDTNWGNDCCNCIDNYISYQCDICSNYYCEKCKLATCYLCDDDDHQILCPFCNETTEIDNKPMCLTHYEIMKIIKQAE
jgi:hypothetical protein